MYTCRSARVGCSVFWVRIPPKTVVLVPLSILRLPRLPHLFSPSSLFSLSPSFSIIPPPSLLPPSPLPLLSLLPYSPSSLLPPPSLSSPS